MTSFEIGDRVELDQSPIFNLENLANKFSRISFQDGISTLVSSTLIGSAKDGTLKLCSGVFVIKNNTGDCALVTYENLPMGSPLMVSFSVLRHAAPAPPAMETIKGKKLSIGDIVTTVDQETGIIKSVEYVGESKYQIATKEILSVGSVFTPYQNISNTIKCVTCAVEFAGGKVADFPLESLHLATEQRKVEFQSKKLQAEIDELDKTIQAQGAEIMRIATENQANIQKKNELLAKLNK